MSHSFSPSFLAFFLFSTFLITTVRSDAKNLFLEALEDVQTDVDALIAPDNRDEFFDNFYTATDLLKGFNIGELFTDLEDGTHDNKTCHICDQVMGLGKMLLQTPQLVKALAKSICAKASYSERVCEGTLERMADPVVYILQHTKLSTAEICSVLLHPDCMTHLNKPMTKNILWELPLPKKKEFKPLNANLKPLKMLHLSDVHLDLWYTPGANSLCDEPVCCRAVSRGSNRSAGFWSETEFACDTPQVFAETAIRQIADKHKDIDFVIWTGDNVPHDVYNTTIPTNLMHIKTMTDIVKASFKDKPLFLCLGNHETHPINLYVPSDVPKESNFSMSWLYDTLSDDYWSQWIHTESAKNTFKRGGYYSALVNKGLKVIAINNNICDRGSYWSAYNPHDFDGQLQWLINELEESETHGRHAMIIGHHPPDDCIAAWTNNYFRIMERYQHLIVGTYFGHTHKDEFMVLHNKNVATNKTYPVSIAYISPSITTFADVNPGYRIFKLDKNGKPLDFTTYYTDIMRANYRGAKFEPEWEIAFSAKEGYGLPDLSVESWDKFITRAATDDELTENYVRNYHRFSEAFVLRNNDTIEYKRDIIQNRRVVNPIYEILTHHN